TTYLPMDERHNYSRRYSEAVLTYALGGRVAENLVFGEVSSGAQQDYKMATDLGRRMVCDWGMSDRLGPLAYGQKNDEVFLGREMAQRRNYSEKVAETIDEEIKVFILAAEKRAEKLLQDNLQKLHLLAEALLEFEVLDDTQLDRIMAGEKLEKPVKGDRAAKKKETSEADAKPEEPAAEEPPEEGEEPASPESLEEKPASDG
ncbi:MAG: cell division protein FtsH, partial [Candidatus Latescibacteria bacterium]|nr:cell division protein FtsH [Candidatus Latescibacterota bacterium]